MKVALIGHRGLIGTELKSLFRRHQHQIYELTLAQFDLSVHPYSLTEDKIRYLTNKLDEISPDCLINLAWITSPNDYRSHSSNLIFSEFACALFDLCNDAKVPHYIGLGSSAEYGKNPGICNERTSPLISTDLYSESKINAFLHLSAHHEGGTAYSWARVFQVFGKQQSREKMFRDVIENLRVNHEFILRNPDTILDWIAVHEVGISLLHIMEMRLTGPLNVGTGSGISNIDFVNCVRDCLFSGTNARIATIQAEKEICVADSSSILLQTNFLSNRTLRDAMLKEMS